MEQAYCGTSDRRQRRRDLIEARTALRHQLDILYAPARTGAPPDNRSIIETLETQLREIDIELAKGVRSEHA
jgi:hypothetical protein